MSYTAAIFIGPKEVLVIMAVTAVVIAMIILRRKK